MKKERNIFLGKCAPGNSALPDFPSKAQTLQDTSVLARTIYGEARGEYSCFEGGLASLIAVGNVVMNRLGRKTRYGNTLRDVCLQPFQFSCWNDNDPNRKEIQAVTLDNPIFALCWHVSESLMHKKWPDLTKGATHYYAVSLPKVPFWAKNPTVRIGHHIFCRVEPT
jgi:spore germination cell wall hydrolase CwlJ-like protein